MPLPDHLKPGCGCETSDILSGRALPRQGVIPLDRVLAALRALHYDGWYTVEVFNPPLPPADARHTAELARTAALKVLKGAWHGPA